MQLHQRADTIGVTIEYIHIAHFCFPLLVSAILGQSYCIPGFREQGEDKGLQHRPGILCLHSRPANTLKQA
jgi:hypothetical protein